MRISKKLSQKVLTSELSCGKMTYEIRKLGGETVTVDTKKLIGKIYENGYNRSSFADELQISRETLRKYIRNPQCMPYNIIEQAIGILRLSSDEAKDIFFAS